MSVRESPPTPASRSRAAMARMAVSFVVRYPYSSSVVRMLKFGLTGHPGLIGRQGLSPHGGRDCLLCVLPRPEGVPTQALTCNTFCAPEPAQGADQRLHDTW